MHFNFFVFQKTISGKSTIRRAAKGYGVPKSTLHVRVSGKVGSPPQYLNDEEEEELVRWLEGCAEVGCAKSIRVVVGAFVAKKYNLDHAAVSHGWWDRSRAQHPHLRLRAGECLTYVCTVCTNRQILDKYFDLWECVVLKNDSE